MTRPGACLAVITGPASHHTLAAGPASERTLPVLVATVATGLAAGLGGAALTLALHAVQHVLFGYPSGSFLAGAERAGPLRRVAALSIGGTLVAAGWWVQRRVSRRNVSVTHALALSTPEMPVRATLADAVLQIVAVGAGASLGREGAPRQVGAALGGRLAAYFRLEAGDRRILLAAGAGAGLAAVYNVPIAGAVFTLEVLLRSARPRAVLIALTTSAVATVVAWPVVGRAPTYHLAAAGVSSQVAVAAILIGPVTGVVGIGIRQLLTRARTGAARGGRAFIATPLAFAALGATAIPYPELLGNGKGLAQLAFTGGLSATTAAALVVLKPLVTAACLRGGAIGGLLTPTFATGAALGLLLGRFWTDLWPGATPASYAILGAATLLAVAQRAPLTAVILGIEFTHANPGLLIPAALSVALGIGCAHTLSTLSHRHRRGSRRRLILG